MSSLTIVQQISNSLSFLQDLEIDQYVNYFYASRWGIRVEMTRSDIPDTDFRKIKRVFGKDEDENHVATMKLVDNPSSKDLSGKFTFKFNGEEHDEKNFDLELKVENVYTCEKVDITDDFTEAQWKVLRNRIEKGKVPITVCDPVEFKRDMEEAS